MQKREIKLIDKTVAKAQQNKMAGRLRNNNVLIQSLKENALNKNTQQSTNTWLKVWKSWVSQKGCDESIEKYEPEAEQISRGPGFKPSHTIKQARNINSQLARGNSFTQSVIKSSTSSSSNIFNLFSPVPQCGSNFNQVVFAFQMPSYKSGQNDQRQCFVNINHFHQRQVTFNAGNTAAPEKPQSAAPPGEDSISN